MWPRTQQLVLIGIAWAWLMGIALLVGLVLLSGMEPAVRDQVHDVMRADWGVLVLAALLALAIPVGILGLARVRTRATLRRLAADTRLIGDANPAWRIPDSGFAERSELADAINALAERLDESANRTTAGIEAATMAARMERDRLLDWLGALPAGVLVCGADGRVTLANAEARRLLGDEANGALIGRLLGELLGAEASAHARVLLSRRLAAGQEARAAVHCANLPAHSVLATIVAPRTDSGDTHLVVHLRAVDNAVERSTRHDREVAPSLARARDATAGLMLATEALGDAATPANGEARLLLDAAGAEGRALVSAITALEAAARHDLPLPGESCSVADLLDDAQLRVAQKLAMDLLVVPPEDTVAQRVLRGDPLLLVRCLGFLASRLRYECRAGSLRLAAAADASHVTLTFAWTGEAPDAEMRRRFVTEPLRLGGEASALTLAQALRRHGGVVWFAALDDGTPAFHLVLPAAPAATSRPQATGPAVYDTGAQPASGKADARLDELAGTAFAVSGTVAAGLPVLHELGAVRVMGTRLVAGESCDRHVDPDAAGGSDAATAVAHLHAFARSTVLIGAGIAASLPPLRAHETRAGAWFGGPALDVLLLARAVEQQATDGSLASLADRLGVDPDLPAGAAGDARRVAQVWRKLLPLLAQQGIATLEQALVAQAGAATARKPREDAA